MLQLQTGQLLKKHKGHEPSLWVLFSEVT